MNRRGLLGAVLAASVAPAFVKAGVLMPLWVPQLVWVDVLLGEYGEGGGLNAFADEVSKAIAIPSGVWYRKDERAHTHYTGRVTDGMHLMRERGQKPFIVVPNLADIQKIRGRHAQQ